MCTLCGKELFTNGKSDQHPPLAKMQYQQYSRYLHMLIWNLWLLLLECAMTIWLLTISPFIYWFFMELVFSLLRYSDSVLSISLTHTSSLTLAQSPDNIHTSSSTLHLNAKIASSYYTCNPHCWYRCSIYPFWLHTRYCLNILHTSIHSIHHLLELFVHTHIHLNKMRIYLVEGIKVSEWNV